MKIINHVLFGRSDTVRRGRHVHSSQPKALKGDVDTVTLSQDSIDYLAFKEKALSVPEIREVLIASIKEEIASGNYRIDAEKLAEALIREGLF